MIQTTIKITDRTTAGGELAKGTVRVTDETFCIDLEEKVLATISFPLEVAKMAIECEEGHG